MAPTQDKFVGEQYWNHTRVWAVSLIWPHSPKVGLKSYFEDSNVVQRKNTCGKNVLTGVDYRIMTKEIAKNCEFRNGENSLIFKYHFHTKKVVESRTFIPEEVARRGGYKNITKQIAKIREFGNSQKVFAKIRKS